jgi:hypothetical protein
MVGEGHPLCRSEPSIAAAELDALSRGHHVRDYELDALPSGHPLSNHEPNALVREHSLS